MITHTITINELPNGMITVDSIPLESGVVTDREKIFEKIFSFSIMRIYETVVVQTRRGKIVNAEALSPIWDELNQKIKELETPVKMMACGNCGKSIAEGSTDCPHCLATDFET